MVFIVAKKDFLPGILFFTSALVFAGSMEFILVPMSLGPLILCIVFSLTLMINFRHLFYGISMLEKFNNTGWKKFFLIFGMCDETFAINCNANIPKDIDKGWFMTFVTLLNQIYWVVGATAGALLGNIILTSIPKVWILP